MGPIRKFLSDRVKTIDPENPQPEIIDTSIRILQAGGVISFPTKCLYGLGADALNPDAVEMVFKIKQRPHRVPLLVLIGDIPSLDDWVKEIPSAATHIIDKLWPGGVTLVFEARDHIPENLTGGTGKIGVRMPQHPVALALAKRMGGPITGTSANFYGYSGCSEIDHIDFLIAEKLDLILDAGPLEGGVGSTVVDVTGEIPRILREGVVPAEDIYEASRLL